MTTTSPSAHGESRQKASRPHQPPHNRAWRRISLRYHGHLTRASERRATRVLVNRHKSYLALVEGVKVQASAGQRLPRRIKKEEMKRRIIHRIALTPARLTPRLRRIRQRRWK